MVEAAKKALDDGHHGYVMSNGIPECRQAVTRWIKKRYSVDIDFERILIMPGRQTNYELCNSMFW